MGYIERNAALERLYCRHWATFERLRSADKDLSNPYLAWVHPDYETARVRLVVVGKETNGWANEVQLKNLRPNQAVRALMNEYRDFRLGIGYSGKRSFWTPVHELYRQLNPTERELGFVALNASKMDWDSSIPPWAITEALVSTGILPEEIRILEPHVVVFHTGPAYESLLDKWFPSLERHGDNFKAVLTSPDLPSLAFRTYHPRYLNYRSRRKEVYNWIVGHVGAAAA
jgi:hypothetical protein